VGQPPAGGGIGRGGAVRIHGVSCRTRVSKRFRARSFRAMPQSSHTRVLKSTSKVSLNYIFRHGRGPKGWSRVRDMRPMDIQQIGQELAVKWDDGTESFISLEKLR